MSVLSGKLNISAGLGGTSQGGPAQSYGAAMPASSTGSGIFADFRNANTDVRQGRISIAVLETMLILIVIFYIWTHNVQGGG